MTTIERKLWTIKDIMDYTGKSRSVVYEYLKLGIIGNRCRARGRGRFIPEKVMADFEAWKESNE